jgi:hypothetical protein
MGHIRFGTLSQSKKWRQVVELLRVDAGVEDIAAAAADAAETSLQGAANDPAFLHAFWLLTQIPLAARGPAFAEDLRRLGFRVPDQPSLMAVVAAFSDAVDRHARDRGGRTDLGEMAQMAAVEGLMATVGPALPSLFEPGPGEVQRAIGRLASGGRFSVLAHAFFARLTERSLEYYLSRELANHIGPSGRFADDGERAEFDAALGSPLPGGSPDRRGVRRWLVRQERLSGRWADARCRRQVRPGRLQENPGRAAKAPRCRNMSIWCCVAGWIGRAAREPSQFS